MTRVNAQTYLLTFPKPWLEFEHNGQPFVLL